MSAIVGSVLAVALLSGAAACGKSGGGGSPTAPSNTTPPTPTRVIRLTGDLTFGTIQVGQSRTLTFTVHNDGTDTLTYTGLQANNNLSSVMKASPTSGSIAAGGTQDVTVSCTPAAATGYGGVITVVGNQTSGNSGINTTCSGTFEGIPLFEKSGSGNDVFDIPARVTRIRITGTYTGNSSNFVVYIAGRLVVNDLVGTGWGTTTSTGTYAIAGGGTAEIKLSQGVDWTFTEVR